MEATQAIDKIEFNSKQHAHRCENCFRNGVTVVWVHDDSHAGNSDDVKVSAGHTCPQCGKQEWKKWLLPVGKLPPDLQQRPFVHFVALEQLDKKFVYFNLDSVLPFLVWTANVLLAAYLIFRLYQYYKSGPGGGTGGDSGAM